MTKYIVGVLIGWVCSAQTTIMSPEQIQAALLRDMRGDTGFDLHPLPDNPHSLFGPVEIRDSRSPERSSGESISIKQLRHKVPKETSRAAVRAKKWSRAGDHSKAAVELEAAIRRDPEFVAAYNALGVEYERCGRLVSIDPSQGDANRGGGISSIRSPLAAGSKADFAAVGITVKSAERTIAGLS